MYRRINPKQRQQRLDEDVGDDIYVTQEMIDEWDRDLYDQIIRENDRELKNQPDNFIWGDVAIELLEKKLKSIAR